MEVSSKNEDIDVVEPVTKTLVHRTNGVKWFPLPEIQSASVLNELILQAGKDLAREGKRVSDVPKYLVDGIVIPWILDFSVVESDVETSIRSILKKRLLQR
ncbi:hypothetical protein C8Q75DRAFT_771522 [Abortiporus biennis]|nr:hypothetical protein C8Q75DRAFT_771522 [Abortiporus biennis]